MNRNVVSRARPRSADTQVQLSAVLPGRHPGEGPMTGNRADEAMDKIFANEH